MDYTFTTVVEGFVSLIVVVVVVVVVITGTEGSLSNGHISKEWYRAGNQG